MVSPHGVGGGGEGLHSCFRQENFILNCLSPPRCINGNHQTVRET